MHKEEGSVELTDPSRLLQLLERYQSSLPAPSSHVQRYPLTAREVEVYKHLEAHLTLWSQQLARDADLRQSITTSGTLNAILGFLNTFFPVFQRTQDARPPRQEQDQQDLLDDRPLPNDNDKEKSQDPYLEMCQIATLCMRIIRNAMARCSDAQDLVCSRFDLLAPFLDNITRFYTLNDPEAALLSRSAVQMLANLITDNRDVQRSMWPRIVTTNKEQDKLILKFLSSPDTATQSAAQILLINFVRTPSWSDDALGRCFELCTSTSGQQHLQSLLSTSESIMLRTATATHDRSSEEYEPESEIEGLEESLGFIYTIFAILFERGFSSLLVSSLAPLEEISSAMSASPSDRPIITSSQLTLLKLLDSWLHLQQKQVAESEVPSESGSQPTFELTTSQSRSNTTEDKDRRGAGLAGLVEVFMQLSKFARSAMASGIAKDGASADQQPQDRRLIGVHHGLLLLLQSLLSISMTADGWSDEHTSLDHPPSEGKVGLAELSRALLSDMRGNETFVDELVALLDQTHQYAPALSPFRPVDAKAASRNAADESARNRPLPQGHALSATGRAANESEGTQPSYGFDHLKRDIVRVLGSLVYAPTQTGNNRAKPMPSSRSDMRISDSAFTKSQIRQVQDRVREKGGLFHVLNMTVLDERNPYMREHAIFALRYLLAGNAESQSLVGSLQPAQTDGSAGGMQLPMV